MLYIVLFTCCLCTCFLLCLHLKFGEQSILRYILETNNIFCIQYLVFSCIFLYFEIFLVWKPLLCILLLNGIIILFMRLKKCVGQEWKGVFKLEKSEGILLVAVVFLVVPFIYLTTEDIGTVSDQGAYFLHSIALMEEKSNNIHQLQEMDRVSEIVNGGLRDLQKKSHVYNKVDGEDYYYVFGLGTWCSFTALFGKMLGIWNCMRGVNYLYVLAILNMFYLCKKIAKNTKNVYLSIGTFALSPVILYIGKAGLTEVLMLCLFSMGLYYAVENKIQYYVIAGMSVGLIGFIHVSIFAYIPIITVLAMLWSSKREHKQIAFFNIIQLFLFSCSIWYVYRISPIYVEKQYLRFTFNGVLEYPVIFIGINVLVGILIVLQTLILLDKVKFIDSIRKFIYINFNSIFLCVLIVIIAATIYYAYFVCFTDKFSIPEGVDAGTWNLRSGYVNKGVRAISHLNIVNIARGTGIAGLLFFLILPFKHRNLSDLSKTFYFLGLYGLFIFTVLQMDTPSNYYCSRYFVPFAIPMITVSLVSSVKKKSWIVCILFITLLFNRRYWFSFLQGAPQKGQYELLQDTLEIIPQETIVFMNEKSEFLNTRLTSNLRILNENEVYNLKNHDEVIEYYPKKDKYIVSEEELSINAELILSDVYLSQYSFGNGPNGTYEMGVGIYEVPINIYKVKQ